MDKKRRQKGKNKERDMVDMNKRQKMMLRKRNKCKKREGKTKR